MPKYILFERAIHSLFQRKFSAIEPRASCYREKLLGVGMVFVAQSVTLTMPLHPKSREFTRCVLFAGRCSPGNQNPSSPDHENALTHESFQGWVAQA